MTQIPPPPWRVEIEPLRATPGRAMVELVAGDGTTIAYVGAASPEVQAAFHHIARLANATTQQESKP